MAEEAVETTEVVESADVATEATPADVAPREEVSRADLESKTAERLAKTFADESEDDTEVVDSPDKTGATPPAAEKTMAATPAKVVEAAEPVVPAAYRRSLKAYQWTDEEIDNAARANPANFLATASKLHDSRTQQTREMSDLGRRLKEQQKATEGNTAASLPQKFTPIDIAALKKTYGDEPFIKQIEGLNQIVDFANTVGPWMHASQARQQAAELETLGRQIDAYFGDKAMAPYHDVYGKTGAQLDDKQLTARQQVLDTADLLITGARQLGKNLTLDEALTLAHDSVSGPVREAKVRQKIVTAVKARQAAVSLKPGGRASTIPQDRKALEGQVKGKLAAVFST